MPITEAASRRSMLRCGPTGTFEARQPACHFPGCLSPESQARLRLSQVFVSVFCHRPCSLRELAYYFASLIPTFREPDICLFAKADDGFGYFETFQYTGLYQENQ